jgi:deoxycytidylate deaminase
MNEHAVLLNNIKLNSCIRKMSIFTSESIQVCTTRDEKYASLALHAANNSNMKYHQHGCIAVADGTVLASGCNSYGIPTVMAKDKYLQTTCTCHAEADVLRKIERLLIKKQLHNTHRTRFLSRISIYVVRKDKRGNQYKDSTPCLSCGNFMKSLNIKNVIYSNASGTLTKCRVRDYKTSYSSQGTRFLNRNYVNREFIVYK